MQRYEEYKDSPTTMAKRQPWLLKEEPIVTLNSNMLQMHRVLLQEHGINDYGTEQQQLV